MVEALNLLQETDQFARQHNFVHWLPEIATIQILTLLHQRNLTAAADLAEQYDLPLSQARVYLAQEDPPAALAVLDSYRQQVESKGWRDERLKVLVLQAVALHKLGNQEQVGQLIGEALALAEPGGIIRIFVDEGQPMPQLLYEALAHGITPNYVRQLLAAFPAEELEIGTVKLQGPEAEGIEPLSDREIEVLQLVSQGLPNQEIAGKLYVSLNTIKAHTRNIYSKLGVNNRTQAVAKARALGILPAT